jgi:GTP-binding protein Era
MEHKSGFVNIIGNPNVGKSTLMNSLVGEKISIITSKSQTTRHRILGIVNGDDFQIVYSDTPGVIKPHYKLQKAMLGYSEQALEDGDILLYVTDVYETTDKNQEFLDKVVNSKAHVILVINKIDLSDQETVVKMQNEWQEVMPKAEVILTSALTGFNIEKLLNSILDKLPEGPPYYPKDALTDKTERFFVEEIIREKILIHYKKEIPYSTQAIVEEFHEDEKIIRIRAIIYVERESQKPIIIGHKGSALKRVGVEARKDLEKFFGKQVHLELYVKVNKNWRSNQAQLKRFGYNQR